MTLNHPSLMDEEEETRVLVMTHKREKGKRCKLYYVNCVSLNHPIRFLSSILFYHVN